MFRLNVQAQTVTLPLNAYLDLCSQHASNEEMDEFLMYIYKVKRCPRTRAHDWTECPYAHRGEKARRRDPRKFPYQGVVCPEFKNGECKKGQNCECAHGIFEFWLHPSRFRTRVCESGVLCPRKVCFFAHTPEQLRPEGAHHCSRCAQRASTTGAAPAAAAAVPAKEKAIKKCEAPPPTAPRETTPPSVLAAPSSSAEAAEGSSGGVGVAREAVDEKYTDFSHLGWVVDLVDW